MSISCRRRLDLERPCGGGDWTHNVRTDLAAEDCVLGDHDESSMGRREGDTSVLGLLDWTIVRKSSFLRQSQAAAWRATSGGSVSRLPALSTSTRPLKYSPPGS